MRLPHFSWIFIVHHRDMSGKELEYCMARYGDLAHDAILAFLIRISTLVQKQIEVLIILVRYRCLF